VGQKIRESDGKAPGLENRETWGTPWLRNFSWRPGPPAMDIVMGKCAGGDPQKCFNVALQGLRKEDRSHVHLVEGNDKNGFKKGQFGITVDADYKSSSKNFTTLQKLANDHSATGFLNVVAPTENFLMVSVTGWSSQSGAKYANAWATLGHLQDPVSFHAYTLYSLVGSKFSDNAHYTPYPFSEVYANSEDTGVELTKDIHHELRHLLLGDFGRRANEGGHNNPNVEKEVREAEEEAGSNAKN
jgi:hypothetical protein